MIGDHHWHMESLHDIAPFMNQTKDRRSWLEIHQDYTVDETHHHELLNITQVLWTTACMDHAVFSQHDVFFQFHLDKCGVCQGLQCHTHRPGAWAKEARANRERAQRAVKEWQRSHGANWLDWYRAQK